MQLQKGGLLKSGNISVIELRTSEKARAAFRSPLSRLNERHEVRKKHPRMGSSGKNK